MIRLSRISTVSGIRTNPQLFSKADLGVIPGDCGTLFGEILHDFKTIIIKQKNLYSWQL